MSYIIMRMFHIPKDIASHFYWNRFSVIEILLVIITAIRAGYIHA